MVFAGARDDVVAADVVQCFDDHVTGVSHDVVIWLTGSVLSRLAKRVVDRCTVRLNAQTRRRAGAVTNVCTVQHGLTNIPFTRESIHEANPKQTNSIYTCTTCALSLLHVCFLVHVNGI